MDRKTDDRETEMKTGRDDRQTEMKTGRDDRHPQMVTGRQMIIRKAGSSDDSDSYGCRRDDVRYV